MKANRKIYTTKNYQKIRRTFSAWRKRNAKRRSEYDAKYRQKWKQAVVDGYGGKCACCGIEEIVFLNVDHINGSGTADRIRAGGSFALWRELIHKDFPTGYQILCFNCNRAKYVLGICPHQVK